ncbi:MAG: ABC transporter substrate-binding protein [Sulfolobales archaeon]
MSRLASLGLRVFRGALVVLLISLILLNTPYIFITLGGSPIALISAQTQKPGSLSPITCPKVGGTVVVIHWGDPKSFNPDSQVDDALFAIASQIYNKLINLDVNYNIIPELAESWEIAPNGSTFIFHLVKNATWHDGYPFTSADVKYTLEAIKKYKGVMYSFLMMDKLISVDTPDNYTVIVRYSAPFPAFLSFLAWYGTFILPEHIFNKTEYKDWMDPSIPALQRPIGTGPFKFVEYVKGDHVTLEANPNYFKGRPCVDRVVFKIVPDPTAALQSFLAGEGDWLTNAPPPSEIPRINSTPGFRVETRLVPSRWYIAFNLLNPMLADVRMRYAIAYAINRSEIVEKALSGYGMPAQGMYTPVISWAYNPNATEPPYDPAKASQLLDELGYKIGSDGYRYTSNGTRLTLRLDIFQGAVPEGIAAVIKDDLRKVGIDVKIEEYEIAAWEDKVVKKRDFDLALLDGFQGPDPDNMRSRFGPGAYLNMANYSNPEFGELLNKAAVEPNFTKRQELYWKAQEIMARDLPYLILADLMAFFIYRTEWHNFYWQLPGVAGLNTLERVWWDRGTPTTITPTPSPLISTTAAPTETATSAPVSVTTPTTTISPTTTPALAAPSISLEYIALIVVVVVIIAVVLVILLRRR